MSNWQNSLRAVLLGLIFCSLLHRAESAAWARGSSALFPAAKPKETAQVAPLINGEAAGQRETALLAFARLELVVARPSCLRFAETSGTTSPTSGHELDRSVGGGSSRPTPTSKASLKHFFTLGLIHPLTDFNHLLFVAALLLGLSRPTSATSVLGAFTLAHLITLRLGAFQFVSGSSHVVDYVVAASVLAACIVNLVRPHVLQDRIWLSLIFGLFHGMDFASVFQAAAAGERTGDRSLLLVSYASGVEAALLAAAFLFLVLLAVIRRWWGFARYGPPSVSTVLIFVSGYWMLDRISI